MKKILVTGGAGFIGAHLVDKILQNKKYKVMIVDNLKTKGGIPYVNPYAKFYKGDILNPKTLEAVKNWKPDVIFHLAAQAGGEGSYDNPKMDFLVNGFGTMKLAELAKKINCKKFIYTSTVAVYGNNIKKINENSKIDPESYYGISKFAGEQFLKQIFKKDNTKVTIFRLFNTFGPGEDLRNTKKGMVGIYSYYLWQKKPLVVKGSLNRFRNFVYIDDCIRILYDTINNKKLKKHEIINLTSGKKVTVKKLINLIFKINNLDNYPIVVKKNTPGDSFGMHASEKLLLNKFKNFEFMELEKSLTRYFNWIKKIPINANLKKFHPLERK
jgi:UDP-glucose 4-epimerase